MRGPTLPGRVAACVAAYLLMIGAASGEYTRTACGTWADVRAECHALGGDLVVIQSAEKNAEMLAFKQSFDDWGMGCEQVTAWIGAYNCNANDGCQWTDGSAWTTSFHDASFWGDGGALIGGPGICDLSITPPRPATSTPAPAPTSTPDPAPTSTPAPAPTSTPTPTPTSTPAPTQSLQCSKTDCGEGFLWSQESCKCNVDACSHAAVRTALSEQGMILDESPESKLEQAAFYYKHSSTHGCRYLWGPSYFSTFT